MLNKRYDTDLTDAAWELVGRVRPMSALLWTLSFICCERAANGACFHTGTHHGHGLHYFRCWEAAGIWAQLHRAIYEQTRIAAGRATSPSVVIMDSQSVKTWMA